jgi:hypothetical protein
MREAGLRELWSEGVNPISQGEWPRLNWLRKNPWRRNRSGGFTWRWMFRTPSEKKQTLSVRIVNAPIEAQSVFDQSLFTDIAKALVARVNGIRPSVFGYHEGALLLAAFPAVGAAVSPEIGGGCPTVHDDRAAAISHP